MPPPSRTTDEPTAIRPRAAVTSAPTIDCPRAPTFCEPTGSATADPAGTVRSVQALLRTGGSSGRYSVTLITASSEKGFITTKKECERWVVTASTTSHCSPADDVHGSAPRPGSFAPPHTTHPTAAQPPNTSTRVDAARADASTCWRTSPWGGTETSFGSPTGVSAYDVSRASSVAPVGFAISIVAVHPGPPPCGQSQVVDDAAPGVAAAGAAGPRRVAASAPTSARAARVIESHPRPPRIIDAPASGSPTTRRPTRLRPATSSPCAGTDRRTGSGRHPTRRRTPWPIRTIALEARRYRGVPSLDRRRWPPSQGRRGRSARASRLASAQGCPSHRYGDAGWRRGRPIVRSHAFRRRRSGPPPAAWPACSARSTARPRAPVRDRPAHEPPAPPGHSSGPPGG